MTPTDIRIGADGVGREGFTKLAAQLHALADVYEAAERFKTDREVPWAPLYEALAKLEQIKP